MDIMKKLIIMLVMILLPVSLFASDSWDDVDKLLFGYLTVAMIGDGITTHNATQDGFYTVNPLMPDNPKGSTLVAHMIGQTIIQYFIADELPELWSIGGYIIQPRKIFLSTAITFRVVCNVHNLQITHGF